MNCQTLLTTLNILVAFIGVLFVALAVVEYTRLRHLRRELSTFKAQWYQEQARLQKAQQRVMASYTVQDIDRRIALLKSAVEGDPKTFNGYNALGYAYLEKNDRTAALDAFKEAINQHPEMKEGYFDLARLYFKMGKSDLCRKYLNQAIKIDSSSHQEIVADEQLSAVMNVR